MFIVLTSHFDAGLHVLVNVADIVAVIDGEDGSTIVLRIPNMQNEHTLSGIAQTALEIAIKLGASGLGLPVVYGR